VGGGTQPVKDTDSDDDEAEDESGDSTYTRETTAGGHENDQSKSTRPWQRSTRDRTVKFRCRFPGNSRQAILFAQRNLYSPEFFLFLTTECVHMVLATVAILEGSAGVCLTRPASMN
jgi:hypothetical protein